MKILPGVETIKKNNFKKNYYSFCDEMKYKLLLLMLYYKLL